MSALLEFDKRNWMFCQYFQHLYVDQMLTSIHILCILDTGLSCKSLWCLLKEENKQFWISLYVDQMATSIRVPSWNFHEISILKSPAFIGKFSKMWVGGVAD